MNRSNLIKAVADAEQLPVAEVQRVLDALLKTVANSLAEGQDVSLWKFGRFKPRHRGPVVRKNPRTGVAHSVPAKVSIGFVPSEKLRARVNGSDD